ncbi:hypothetical protein [Variovorax ginsengisoli]|uniref:Uncharacterized protein n=1 Tax=Variovorax ginsengisoli TaxID=363844 RepID=A0ABT9S7X4_9BURK|nr:hypothetical protein [Variovorax ginsengisoli]MDP9900450.1 hypothetical protein [Variovorax ginsengisoli]
MKEDDEQGEDIAGLFKKFGGDAKGYREFDHTPADQESPWRLLPGGHSAETPVIAPAPPPLAPPPAAPPALVVPRAAAPAPVPASVFATAMPPMAAPVAVPEPASVPATPVTAPATRPLDVLFARLAAETAAPAEAGHTLLSRWRRPS